MKENELDLTPDEIRAIRMGLGLSQVEAGELLGGGPRAFTKYEAGTVKPAASVRNLLRLLEANPNMMVTLRGDRSRPMTATAEHGPFEVTGEHITALTARTFHLLLSRLLHTEAQANGLPANGIHVAESITTPDGGEDGRISWQGGPDRTPFLPSRLNQFQLKAGEISPSEAGQEILTKSGTVKEMVRSVLEAGGHYIMLCAHSYVEKTIERREESIRKKLRHAGISIDDKQIQFRDASQIAAWANHHPSVATWVKEQTQPGVIGPFRSWTYWAGRAEHDGIRWVEDERLPVLRTRLLEQAIQHKGVFRVLGLSGIGKSRLVLEALDTEDAGSFLSDIVIYADESESDSSAIKSTVQTWADVGARIIVIVDRCPLESHTALAGLVSRHSSRLSLVTIDNEIPSGTPDDTTFKVDKASHPVIEAIVDQVVPALPSEDRRRLVHFSVGFPGIAVRIGRTWDESRPVAHATEDSFINAFVLGREKHECELLLRSAMLFATFGMVVPSAEPQLDEIASRGRNLTTADLRFALAKLVDRGVVQLRGRLAVFPTSPMAMGLAGRQWREWSQQDWDDVLTKGATANLEVSAARRLALLNTTSISHDVVVHVCRRDGPLDGIDKLSSSGNAEILPTLAEIDAEIVVRLIERSLDAAGDLSSVQDDLRRNLLWALEKIAFRPDTFDDAARILRRLAVAEKELRIGNTATDLFKALFPMIAGKTAANGNSRLSVLDEATDTDNPIQRMIAVEALVAGTKTDHFWRFVGVETQGSLPVMDDWSPATYGEASDYIEGCVTRLARLAEQDDDAGIAARAGLGNQLRSLVCHGYIDTVETVVEQVSTATDQWTEALEGLGHFLEYDAPDDDELIGRVRRLVEALHPKQLQSRVRFLVTEMPWDFPCGERLDFDTRDQRQDEAIHALTVEIVERPEILKEVLPCLSRGNQRKAHVFGKFVANYVDSPHEWLELLVLAVLETLEDERNFDLLAGFVVGIAENYPDVVDAFKLKASRSSDLAPAFPPICWRLGIATSDIELAINALQVSLLSPRHLTGWTTGGVLAKLPAFSVAPLFDTMFDHSEEGFAVGIVLMGMYVHGAADRLDALRPQVRKAAKNIGQWELSYTSGMACHNFERIMNWILGKGRQDDDARATALDLANALVNAATRESERPIQPVIRLLLSDFPEIVWPLIGQAIISSQERTWRFEYLFRGRISPDREDEAPILSLPTDALFAWCHAHPASAAAFVATVVPVLTTYKVDAPERSLHPVMSRLLDEFGHHENVLRAIDRNMGTFTWSGSMATYYSLHRESLGSLRNHPKRQVRRWARATLRRLDTQIQNALDEDAEREALRSV